MPYPHFNDFERQNLRRNAERAIESHGFVDPNSLDPETKKMRENQHTGIELTAVELAVLKDFFVDAMQDIRREIPELQRSVRERSASNIGNTEERIKMLQAKLKLLEHNLGEKLFGEPSKQELAEDKDDSGQVI